MLIHADTDYALYQQQANAPQELRRTSNGEYRSAGQLAYRASVPGLTKVAYTGSLAGSLDHGAGNGLGIGSVSQQLRQQAVAGFGSVQIAGSRNVTSYLSLPFALVTGFLTAIAAFTMVLRRPYWG